MAPLTATAIVEHLEFIGFAKQGLHLLMHLLWGCRFLSSNLIGHPLVVANDEQVLPTVRSPRLKERMKLVDITFCRYRQESGAFILFMFIFVFIMLVSLFSQEDRGYMCYSGITRAVLSLKIAPII